MIRHILIVLPGLLRLVGLAVGYPYLVHLLGQGRLTGEDLHQPAELLVCRCVVGLADGRFDDLDLGVHPLEGIGVVLHVVPMELERHLRLLEVPVVLAQVVDRACDVLVLGKVRQEGVHGCIGRLVV